MSHDSLQLLNRFAFQPDGWFQIVPLGEYPHTGSGLVQVLDNTAVRRMAEDFQSRSRVAQFPGLLVDFDHESHDARKSSQAAGWISALENRADGLWARVRWTDAGEAAVRAGRFRLISPVFERASAEDLGNNRVRPVRLLDAGLTNDPNLRNLPPLSNRGGSTSVPSESPMKNVLHALGLSPDACEQAALEAVTSLRTRAEAAERQIPELTNRATAAETDLQALRVTTADADLERFKDRIQSGTEGFWKSNLIANRAETLKALEGLPARGASASPTAKILNRSAAAVPVEREAKSGEQSAADPAGQLIAAVEQFRLANRCTADQAWNAVRASRPDLVAAANATPTAEA